MVLRLPLSRVEQQPHGTPIVGCLPVKTTSKGEAHQALILLQDVGDESLEDCRAEATLVERLYI
jgi:hypothetical protein